MPPLESPPAPSAGSATNPSWKDIVFKNRGLILAPIALLLIIFGHPTTTSAIVGIFVALTGEALRIWAVGYSGVTTRADVVTAPALVTAGPYSRMRNPLYAGNAITALGFWVAFTGATPLLTALLLLIAVLAALAAVYGIVIPLEEGFLARQFGGEYQRYCAQVPRIVPASKPLHRNQQRGRWQADVIARAEIITLLYFCLMLLAVVGKLLWAKG